MPVPCLHDLSAAIRAANLTQNEIAQRLGVSPGAVAAWCARRRIPRGDHLLALATALDIAPAAALDLIRPEGA